MDVIFYFRCFFSKVYFHCFIVFSFIISQTRKVKWNQNFWKKTSTKFIWNFKNDKSFEILSFLIISKSTIFRSFMFQHSVLARLFILKLSLMLNTFGASAAELHSLFLRFNTSFYFAQFEWVEKPSGHFLPRCPCRWGIDQDFSWIWSCFLSRDPPSPLQEDDLSVIWCCLSCLPHLHW